MRRITPSRAGIAIALVAGGLLSSTLPASALDAAPPPRDITEFACPPEEVPDAGYTDVADLDPGLLAIDCVTWWGVSTGTTATTFAPNGSVRRDQMASFLARFIDAIDDSLLPAEAVLDYDDVSPTSVHADAIARLSEAGIVLGVTGDQYAPAVLVTREQTAQLIARALNFVFGEAPVTGPFCSAVGDFYADDDGRASEDCINGLTDVQVIQGTAPGVFAPTMTLTRRQMATLLARSLDLAVEQLSPPMAV